jgi:hypothetical protein
MRVEGDSEAFSIQFKLAETVLDAPPQRESRVDGANLLVDFANATESHYVWI